MGPNMCLLTPPILKQKIIKFEDFVKGYPMDFVETTSKFKFSQRGYPIDFAQKSCQKLTTKGGQNECQKFTQHNCTELVR